MYKRWLIKVVISFLLLLLLISIAYKNIVIDRIYNDFDYQLPESINTVIVGASHLQLGLDDTINENVLNLSNSGMPYYFSYAKSKRLLEHNPQLTKVVISLSPIHVSPYGDSILFSDKGLSRENAFLFFPLMNEYETLGDRRYSVDFIATFLKYKMGVPFNYMDDIKLFLKSLKQEITFRDHVFSGSYDSYKGNNIGSKQIEEKAKLYFDGKEGYSEYSIRTVAQIADLTSKHKVKLFILNMPVYKEFKDLIPLTYIKEQNKIISNLLKKYNHIEYIDYYNYPLLDEDYYDGDHLNPRGAEKLSNATEGDIFF